MSAVHWTAFSDGDWACGGTWPEPVSRRPLTLGPDYPQVTTDPSKVTCEDCLRFARPARKEAGK